MGYEIIPTDIYFLIFEFIGINTRLINKHYKKRYQDLYLINFTHFFIHGDHMSTNKPKKQIHKYIEVLVFNQFKNNVLNVQMEHLHICKTSEQRACPLLIKKSVSIYHNLHSLVTIYEKFSYKFYCKFCNFKTNKSSNYTRHKKAACCPNSSLENTVTYSRFPGNVVLLEKTI